MSGDSIDQWRQTLTPDQIGNWFPPVMVYLWIVLNKLTFGPQGMLIFHYLLYFLSIYGFSRLFLRKLSHRAIYITGIGLFPPLFFLTGVIWKDVSLLVGIANAMMFLLFFERNRRTIFLVLSLLCFLYGILVRHNGLICAIPYSFYAATILFHRKFQFRTLAITVTVIAMTVFFYASNRIISNYWIKEDWKVHYFENAVFIWDLWGMSIEIGKNVVPAYVFNKQSKNLDINEMKAHYNPETNNVIYLMQYITPNRFKRDFPNTDFKKDFIRTILEYPDAYLKVRSRITWFMLGGRDPILPYLFKIQKFPQEHYLHPFSKDLMSHNERFLDICHRIAKLLHDYSPLYKMWIYLFLALLQTLFFMFNQSGNQQNRPFLLILIIGLFYWLPYFIISPATDFRLSSLTIFCTVLILPFFVSKLIRNQHG
ncbi:MAG: hypothetical protein AB1798_10110 [Spirochaetota bacterium]